MRVSRVIAKSGAINGTVNRILLNSINVLDELLNLHCMILRNSYRPAFHSIFAYYTNICLVPDNGPHDGFKRQMISQIRDKDNMVGSSNASHLNQRVVISSSLKNYYPDDLDLLFGEDGFKKCDQIRIIQVRSPK